MGVPSFYRWLSVKYPKVVVDCVEEVPGVVDGVAVPVDASGPNPNGEEFDNLYLDMNGIIHPCFHPEDAPTPSSYDEVFEHIFRYIDRLFCLVRPRKVLFMAIDGVAPRAKMNQQRMRRFRAAKDAEEAAGIEAGLRAAFEAEGRRLPEKRGSEAVDSNVITPGTPFMDRLAKALEYYVHDRLARDPGWKGVKVVLSDSNNPGEGEHKVMEFVRLQRGLEGYDPNTKHVLYGLDADLIMLGLATHEARFHILREVVTVGEGPQKCFICGQAGHSADACRGEARKKRGAFGELDDAEAGRKDVPGAGKPFQMMHLCVLREYLEAELAFEPLPESGVETWDLERVLDDFVFFCFFVGNDFLPHMPTLEIREGAIDLLMRVYTLTAPRLGYLTEGGDVKLDKVQRFLAEVGRNEEAIFRKRARLDKAGRDRARRNRERENQRKQAQMRSSSRGSDSMPMGRGLHASESDAIAVGRRAAYDLEKKRLIEAKQERDDAAEVQRQEAHQQASAAGGKRTVKRIRTSGPSTGGVKVEVKAEVKKADVAKADVAKADVAKADVKAEVGGNGFKKVEVSVEDEEAEENLETMKLQVKLRVRDAGDKTESSLDLVRLGDIGWKERFYREKFGIEYATDLEERTKILHAYVEGLVWVYRYYFDGVASWTWYYPYHYAPFASDLGLDLGGGGRDVGSMAVSFEKGQPFRPFHQLMGVLPAASRKALPEPYHKLMTDADSPIIDFYPVDFDVDMNGKRFAWQGVALLPFIDEGRLLRACETVEGKLTEDEIKRNTFREHLLFVDKTHPLAPVVDAVYERLGDLGSEDRASVRTEVRPAMSDGMNGFVLPAEGGCHGALLSPVDYLDDLPAAHGVRKVVYQYPAHHPHLPGLLEGAELPPRQLSGECKRTAGSHRHAKVWHEMSDREDRDKRTGRTESPTTSVVSGGSEGRERPACRDFQNGNCRRGGSCQFSHDAAAGGSGTGPGGVRVGGPGAQWAAPGGGAAYAGRQDNRQEQQQPQQPRPPVLGYGGMAAAGYGGVYPAGGGAPPPVAPNPAMAQYMQAMQRYSGTGAGAGSGAGIAPGYGAPPQGGLGGGYGQYARQYGAAAPPSAYPGAYAGTGYVSPGGMMPAHGAPAFMQQAGYGQYAQHAAAAAAAAAVPPPPPVRGGPGAGAAAARPPPAHMSGNRFAALMGGVPPGVNELTPARAMSTKAANRRQGRR